MPGVTHDLLAAGMASLFHIPVSRGWIILGDSHHSHHNITGLVPGAGRDWDFMKINSDYYVTVRSPPSLAKYDLGGA